MCDRTVAESAQSRAAELSELRGVSGEITVLEENAEMGTVVYCIEYVPMHLDTPTAAVNNIYEISRVCIAVKVFAGGPWILGCPGVVSIKLGEAQVFSDYRIVPPPSSLLKRYHHL